MSRDAVGESQWVGTSLDIMSKKSYSYHSVLFRDLGGRGVGVSYSLSYREIDIRNHP